VNVDPFVVRAYRRLLRLYPKRFRDEYGADLVQVLREQCRDEPAWRAAGRAALDLAIAVPTQQLEARMTRTPTSTTPLLYAVVAVAAALVALLAGTNVPTTIVALAVALAAGWVAAVGWARARPLREPDATRNWWKFLLAGPCLIGAVIVASGLGVDAWMLGVACVLMAFALSALGLVLGIVRLATRRATSPG
jgi:hypothetical protein